jgi:hypothetical protein
VCHDVCDAVCVSVCAALTQWLSVWFVGAGKLSYVELLLLLLPGCLCIRSERPRSARHNWSESGGQKRNAKQQKTRRGRLLLWGS